MGPSDWFNEYIYTQQANAEAELEMWVERYSLGQVQAMNDREFSEWSETLKYLTECAVGAQIVLWNHWRVSEHE